MEILKIHATKITKHGDIDYEAVIKLAEGFNGADLRNICTEAGMFAIRWVLVIDILAIFGGLQWRQPAQHLHGGQHVRHQVDLLSGHTSATEE
jgi:hypothetical protein